MTTDRRKTVATLLTGTHTDDVEMDSAGNTVLHLGVDLGKTVSVDNRGIGHILNSSALNNVADSETLDGLVLGHTAAAVHAADIAGVAAVHLGTAVIATLESHYLHKQKKHKKIEKIQKKQQKERK